LRDSETRTLNVAAAMHLGNNNTIRLLAHGPKGSSAMVLVTDN